MSTFYVRVGSLPYLACASAFGCVSAFIVYPGYPQLVCASMAAFIGIFVRLRVLLRQLTCFRGLRHLTPVTSIGVCRGLISCTVQFYS